MFVKKTKVVIINICRIKIDIGTTAHEVVVSKVVIMAITESESTVRQYTSLFLCWLLDGHICACGI